MWGQIIGAGVSAVGNIIGGIQARNAAKKAGTKLVEAGNREAADALAVPGQINPMIGGAYDEAGNLVRTASDQAAGDILGSRHAGEPVPRPVPNGGRGSPHNFKPTRAGSRRSSSAGQARSRWTPAISSG